MYFVKPALAAALLAALSGPAVEAGPIETDALDTIEIVRLVGSPESPGAAFQSVPCVRMRSGRVEVLRAGIQAPLLRALRLPNEIELHPDGVLLKRGAPIGKLAEGERLFMDGALFRPDGSMTYPQEHFVRVKGKLMRVVQGVAEPVPPGQQLENGTWIGEYGRMIMPNGYASHLQDGQIFQPDGQELRAWDTITYRDGRVVLFKDGSLIPLPPGRTMVMNDGTLVRGDGSLLRHSAARAYASEAPVRLSDGDLVRVVRLPGPRNGHRQLKGY
ncbi:MAG: hypothetical protein HYR88_15670 [Verrucomicrobia bacterium]|nr:hypothetical protein [Verrucomicrobiota bacterium]MBI3867743.1 hypothetical protein [Verrucomicrobiota bacterium]